MKDDNEKQVFNGHDSLIRPKQIINNDLLSLGEFLQKALLTPNLFST